MNRTNDNSDKGSPVSRNAGKHPDEHKDGISFTAIVFFVMCLAVTVLMLIAAGVMWIADILNSIPLACLIAGGAAAVISAIIYLVSIRRTVAVLQEYLETVYDTSRMARSGYEQIKAWITFLFD